MESSPTQERASSPESPAADKPRQLPDDLPKSLDDRRAVRSFGGETEIYDAWQGRAQYLSNPVPASPLGFNLAIASDDEEEGFERRARDNDTRLMEMLAAQAAHREDGSVVGDETAILSSEKLSEDDKRKMLQKALQMAASNGDVDRIQRLLEEPAGDYVDINAPDEEGTAPLIYAACFNHPKVVSVLLDAGAIVDRQDRNQWTSLMWAMTNRHKEIVKTLLEHGASPDIKSSSGRTAFDFAAPNSQMSDYLHDNGYRIGDAGVSGDDFYDSGFSQNKFEIEMEENEMKRRMMMESSVNLEVDLSSLGIDERPETPEEELENQPTFVWDRCLYDQMFVFQEEHLDQILDFVITNMVPLRSPSQKPVPANVIFLSARYAHYHATQDLLATLLVHAMDKINDKVESCQWDMTVLAFWISNALLLLHYLKKDPGLMVVTNEFQAQLSELIHEIYILIVRDAERRMDKVLETAMLDHETIPGFEDVHFANEWNIFRKTKAAVPEPASLTPNLGHQRRTQPAPRTVTSLLSSTLFVLDLYDVHSAIAAQILAQLFYWLGAELFNRVLTKRTYLARTKAMQIRMNVSALEDWARANNRAPEHYENGALAASGENTVEAARRHLAPVVQLLQWLQCFSSLGDDLAAFDNTHKQMTRLSPQQLLRASNNYRCEVGEKGLSKPVRKRLQAMDLELRQRVAQARRGRQAEMRSGRAGPAAEQTPPATPTRGEANGGAPMSSPASAVPGNGIDVRDEDEVEGEALLVDPAHMLQFGLPTSVDLRLSYGGGYGGVNKERERRYIPSVPPEVLAKLDPAGSEREASRVDWENEDDVDE